MAKPAENSSSTMARRKVRYGEFAIEGWMVMCAMVSILTTAGILIVLFSQSWLFFRAEEVSVFEFLTGTKWQPLLANQKFGVLPLIGGTLMITVIAGLLALPLGLAIAIYLSEYAGPLQKRSSGPFWRSSPAFPRSFTATSH